MPIYAYRCAACGHSRDVLQKMSDPVLHVCPACGADQFQKQVTAAGFQLKGSGWYATDFKGGNAPATPAKPAAEGATGDAGGNADSGKDGGKDGSKDSGASAPATASAAAPASSSDGGGSSSSSGGASGAGASVSS